MMFKPYSQRTARDFIRASDLSDKLDAWPRAYLGVQWLRLRKARHRIVGHHHRLVIEAFPRSGSSFAHRAFARVNPDLKRQVATHIHRSAQVVRASALGVPTLVLVRDPRDAVTSLLALTIQQDMLPTLSPDVAHRCTEATLLRYARFYERITDLPGVTFAGFDEVTGDFGAVLARMNAAHGTDFQLFEHSEANVKDIMSSTKRHLSPNTDRDTLKADLSAAYEDPTNNTARARAEQAFAAILAKRDAQIGRGQ